MICTLFTGQSSKEGIFMKYSYEFKKECVESYREGKWPDTPEGVEEKNFHDSIKKWFRLEEVHGPEILKHGNNINWTPDEKLEIVSTVIAVKSIKSTEIENGINESEREELIRLRVENEYIQAENEIIKKEIALREKRYAAQLKAKKQRLSNNSKTKDTN